MLMDPIFRKILQEGQEQGCFSIPHLSAATNLLYGILDSLMESLYENYSEEQRAAQFSLSEKLIETIVGAKPGTIHLL